MGSFTAGYQQSNEDTGLTGTAEYDNTSYGITFSVNDDLSIGYGHTESDQSGTANDAEADFNTSFIHNGWSYVQNS